MDLSIILWTQITSILTITPTTTPNRLTLWTTQVLPSFQIVTIYFLLSRFISIKSLLTIRFQLHFCLKTIFLWSTHCQATSILRYHGIIQFNSSNINSHSQLLYNNNSFHLSCNNNNNSLIRMNNSKKVWKN